MFYYSIIYLILLYSYFGKLYNVQYCTPEQYDKIIPYIYVIYTRLQSGGTCCTSRRLSVLSIQYIIEEYTLCLVDRHTLGAHV